MPPTSQSTVVDDAIPAASCAGQFLTFGVNDEVYAIGILRIHEIIQYRSLTVVPLMPDFISGVINLRGNVVPIVNLAKRFNQPVREPGKRSSIIIVEIDGSDDTRLDIGIVVDKVNGVIELDQADIAPPPAFGTRVRTEFIHGIGRSEDRLLILLDIDHVLAIDEISAVATPGEELENASAASFADG